jgi:HD-GYP domain-containing protein (c-di-GMP phosphodiesterase class II)
VDGLRGEEIPLLARVVSVADAFDAMTADRPYRRGLPMDEALKRLELGSGSQWDPNIVNVFLRKIDWSFAA